MYCVFFVQPGQEIPTNFQDSLSNLDIKHFDLCFFHNLPKVGRIRSALRQIKAFPGYYMCIATIPEGRRKIENIIKQYAIDIVHIEHFHYLKYAFQLSGNFRKVVVYHDLHHLIYWQQARFQHSWMSMLISLFTAGKYYLFEKRLDHKVDTKVFLNADEMAVLPKNSVYIPHIVNQDILFKNPKETESYNILFLGGYDHPPNRISLKYIIDHIIPGLAKEKEKFRFHIIGSGTEKFQEIVNNSPFKDLISIHGFIKDINQVFQDMDIALFPILYGGGIKTKIIDSLAAGVPVVTTPEGVIGLNNLPENCIGIGKTANELIDEMIILMNNFPLRLSRSQKGRDYIEREHSFNIFSKKVTETYLNI